MGDHPDPTPDDPASDQPASDQRAPDQPAPDEPTPDEPTPDEPTPDEPTPDEPTPSDPTAPDDPTDDGATSDREDGPDPSEGPPQGAAGQVAGGPGALQPRGPFPGMPPPPRRTGVFLDPDDLRDHVGHLLRVMLGGYEVDAFGNFSFVHESARVFVTVGGSPIGPQVGVFSVTNVDVTLTPQLAAYIATTNHRLGFGALSYDTDNHAVWLRHTLLGTALDAPELHAAVAAVASTAAHLDDQIAEQFGGRTFNDAPADMQRSTRPPEPSQEAFREGGATGYL